MSNSDRWLILPPEGDAFIVNTEGLGPALQASHEALSYLNIDRVARETKVKIREYLSYWD